MSEESTGPICAQGREAQHCLGRESAYHSPAGAHRGHSSLSLFGSVSIGWRRDGKGRFKSPAIHIGRTSLHARARAEVVCEASAPLVTHLRPWSDTPSKSFLSHTCERLAESGGPWFLPRTPR